MLGRLRRCVPARLAAGLLVVSLTGAPRLAGALAEPAEHRCTCAAKGGEHRCECPICRARATHAAPAGKARPPCHGAPAGAPTPAPARAPAERRADLPCLTGACGAPDGPRAVVSGLEPFALADDGAPAGRAPPSAAVPAAPGALLTVPRAPEPPPPRA
jgi:hypothetical protein